MNADSKAGPEGHIGVNRRVSAARFAVCSLQFALSLALLLCAACLHIPGWQTALTVPIVSKTVPIAQLIDTTRFQVEPDSSLEFHFERDLDTISVSQQLNIFQTSDSAYLPLDHFVMTPVVEMRQSLGTGTIMGTTVPESGRIVIPPHQYEGNLTGELTSIHHAQILDGVLYSNIQNLTRVRLDTFELLIPGSQPLELGPIDTMSQVSIRSSIGTATLDSAYTLTLRLVTNGSDGDSVKVFARDSLKMDMRLDSVRLLNGQVELTSHTEMSASHHDVDYLRLTKYRVGIDSLIIRSGTMTFNVDNTIPLPLDIRIIAAEASFDSSFTVAANQDLFFTRELDKTVYRNQDPDSSDLTVTWYVNAVSNGLLVNLDSSQGLSGSIQFQTPAFTYLSGILYDTIWNNDHQTTFTPNFPDEFQHLKFSHAWLQLNLQNAVGFTGLLQAQVTAYNPAGESASLTGLALVGPGTPDQPADSQTQIDVVPLMDINPNRLSLTWHVGLYGRGQAWYESYGTGQALLLTPMRVAFTPETLRDGPWTVPISSEIRPSARQQLDSAEVFGHFVNHFPLAVSGRLLLDDSGPANADLRFGVPCPSLDPVQGWVTVPRDTTVEIRLDSAQSRVFYADSLQAQLEIYVPATDTVTLTARDYFELESSYGRLVMDFAPK
jgi:hypothetical protein